VCTDHTYFPIESGDGNAIGMPVIKFCTVLCYTTALLCDRTSWNKAKVFWDASLKDVAEDVNSMQRPSHSPTSHQPR